MFEWRAGAFHEEFRWQCEFFLQFALEFGKRIESENKTDWICDRDSTGCGSFNFPRILPKKDFSHPRCNVNPQKLIRHEWTISIHRRINLRTALAASSSSPLSDELLFELRRKAAFTLLHHSPARTIVTDNKQKSLNSCVIALCSSVYLVGWKAPSMRFQRNFPMCCSRVCRREDFLLILAKQSSVLSVIGEDFPIYSVASFVQTFIFHGVFHGERLPDSQI